MSEQITRQKFNIKMQKSTLEQVLKSASTIVEEIRFICTDEGINFRFMDPSHVALIDIGLPSQLFEKYEANRAVFALRTDEAFKIVKQFDKDSILNLEIKDSEHITISDHELSYELKLIEAIDDKMPLPKIPYDSLISLGTKSLRNFLTRIEAVSSYCTLKTENNKAFILGSGDLGKCKISLDKEKLTDLKIKEESEAAFSLEYIIPYLKSMTENYIQTFEFSSQKPLRIDSKITNIGHWHFYLAPRVDN